jgi:hypothetical protein
MALQSMLQVRMREPDPEDQYGNLNCPLPPPIRIHKYLIKNPGPVPNPAPDPYKDLKKFKKEKSIL